MDSAMWPAVGAAAFVLTALAARLARPAVTARVRTLVYVAAAATGLAAALIDGPEPTGLAPLDAAYRGLAAAALVRYAPRGRRRTLLAAAIITLLAAHPAPLAASGAAAAVGIVAAMWLTVGYSRVLTTAAAALVALAAQHAAWPDTHGATTALGVVAYALVLVPAFKRRVLVRAALGTAAAVVIVGALAAVIGLSATRPLRAGVAASDQALRAARQGDEAATDAALGRAQSSFGDVRDAARSPLLYPARAIPVLAQHVRALDGAGSAGHTLARRGRQSLSVAALDRLDVAGGGIDTARFAELEVAVGQARDALTTAAGQVDDARSPWLAPTIGDLVDRHAQRLERARRDADLAAEIVEVVPAILGADQGAPRRYFLAIVTPVESRASGGLVGNFGELEAKDGRLRVARFGRSLELNRGGDRANRRLTGPADYLRRYSQFQPATTWQNVTMSPDFPSVADVIGQLYPQSGGTAIDGVLSVDPTALAAILRVTGPVQVPGWPEPITARNAEQILYFDQYTRFAEDDRVDFLGAVARQVVERLTAGRVGGVRRFLDALRPAVEGRHITFTTNRPDEARFLNRVGISGRMAPTVSDHLSLVTQNAGGNKIDWFLHRSVDYDATVADNGAIKAKATVRLRNDAPAAGLPKSVIGSVAQPPVPLGANRLYLSLYTPWRLVGATLGDGTRAQVQSDVELGLAVYSVMVDVPPGGTIEIAFELGGTLPEGPYRLDVGRQATVHDDRVSVSVKGPDGVLVRADQSVTRHLTLRPRPDAVR